MPFTNGCHFNINYFHDNVWHQGRVVLSCSAPLSYFSSIIMSNFNSQKSGQLTFILLLLHLVCIPFIIVRLFTLFRKFKIKLWNNLWNLKKFIINCDCSLVPNFILFRSSYQMKIVEDDELNLIWSYPTHIYFSFY